MADETIRRLFDKLDQLSQQNARVEVLLSKKEKVCDMKFEQIEKLETRVSILEKVDRCLAVALALRRGQYLLY